MEFSLRDRKWQVGYRKWQVGSLEPLRDVVTTFETWHVCQAFWRNERYVIQAPSPRPTTLCCCVSMFRAYLFALHPIQLCQRFAVCMDRHSRRQRGRQIGNAARYRHSCKNEICSRCRVATQEAMRQSPSYVWHGHNDTNAILQALHAREIFLSSRMQRLPIQIVYPTYASRRLDVLQTHMPAGPTHAGSSEH